MASKHEPFAIADIEAAKTRHRRNQSSIVCGQVKDGAQRVHVIVEIHSHSHPTVLGRAIGLISHVFDRLCGKSGGLNVAGDDVADCQVHQRIEFGLDHGQPFVIHFSALPSPTTAHGAVHEGRQ